jgi:hypothetical protein
LAGCFGNQLSCGIIKQVSRKKMKKKAIYFVLITIACLAAGYIFALVSEKQTFPIQDSADEKTPNQTQSAERPISQNVEPETIEEEKPAPISKKMEQAVPFLVQAPFGNWSDSDFQNACEEASMVMAMGWVNGEKTISPQEAKKRILDIIAFENKTFGYSTDTNASDMEKIFRQYFKHENVQAKEDITLEDIKAEIQKGRVVLVPAFGQALKNPNFTRPGPVAHMLIIIGYDPLAKQFITNDPGTRNGAGYRYDESLLFEAIWEYPSGKTDPPLPAGKMRKAMISVSK